jgi:hypothetical protein
MPLTLETGDLALTQAVEMAAGTALSALPITMELAERASRARRLVAQQVLLPIQGSA